MEVALYKGLYNFCIALEWNRVAEGLLVYIYFLMYLSVLLTFNLFSIFVGSV